MKDKKGAFARISSRVKPENKIFVNLGLDISKEIKSILSTHPTIKTQKALAEKMGKEESEISRMLSGLHNITLESISKVSAVLEREIIVTHTKAKQIYSRPIFLLSLTANSENMPINNGKEYNSAISNRPKKIWEEEVTYNA